jgi:hypothetical protein
MAFPQVTVLDAWTFEMEYIRHAPAATTNKV